MARERGRYRRGRRRKKGFSTWSLGKKIGAILGGTITLVALTGAVILASKFSKIEQKKLDAQKLNISEEAKVRGEGYLNVALFGVDSRENQLGKGTLSDTIMIASLNRETLEVKITSVYRDTLLEQKDGSLAKANEAYALGGPEEAVAMLNKNLDMDIEHYVTVNFEAMSDVVDAVGGVEIDVDEEEMPLVCGYVMEIMKVTGRESPGVTVPGVQTLNGIQATAYSRIRYTAGDDYKRTERQREVLTQVIQKLQKASPLQINKIIDKVFPQVSTSFTMAEILIYAKDAFSYKLGEMTGFPFDKTADMLNGLGSVVIPLTLEENVTQLHGFLFEGKEAYTPSSTVVNISQRIMNKSGDRKSDAPEETEGTYQNNYFSEPSGTNSTQGYTNSASDGTQNGYGEQGYNQGYVTPQSEGSGSQTNASGYSGEGQ